MKGSFILSLAAGLAIVSGLGGSRFATADDAKKTEGAWTLVSGEAEGKPLPEQIVKKSTLTIVGDKYTVRLGELGVKQGTQKLDSTTSLKQIDADDAAGPTVGRNLGIYEFTANGDFRVCFAPTGKARPTQFATTPENGQFIHVWRRAEAE
jgi:uncharacterized protein (TIGR03067 family)